MKETTIGSNLKKIRKLKGFTLVELADKLDITYQQLQKYEKGSNRLSSSRLVAVSKILECSYSDILGTDNEPLYTAESMSQAVAVVNFVHNYKDVLQELLEIVE